jgi:hypothetical protein
MAQLGSSNFNVALITAFDLLTSMFCRPRDNLKLLPSFAASDTLEIYNDILIRR